MRDYFIHHVPGRLRIKIEAFKTRPQQLRQAQAVLAGVQGVCTVQLKPTTGSIVVLYDIERTDKQSLLSALTARHLISEAAVRYEKPAERRSTSRYRETAGKIGGKIGKVVVQTALEKLLERSVAALF